MTVQPAHERFDAAVLVRDALREAFPEEGVELARDARYRGNETTTVVQVRLTSLGLPGNRWVFRASVVLSTTGPDIVGCLEVQERHGDVMLSLTEVDGVRFSSVVCENEPSQVSPHEPSGAVMVTSTYGAIMRKENYRG